MMKFDLQTLTGAIAAVCATAAIAGEPVNSKCPISGNAFDEAAATVEVDGNTVGFCCPGCVGPFQSWSAEKKAGFIQASLQARPQQEAAAAKPLGDPYPLDVCPISGGKLGSMGDPVVKSYDGREVRYCCASCTGRFEKDLAVSFAKIDEKIVKSQTPYYPLETCLHCATRLDSEDCTPVDFVYRNRLFRACSDQCRQAVLANPDRAWKTLDAAAMQAQGPHYPLATCVVSTEELGSMGKPREVVVANRLVKLCCTGCEKELKSNPAVVIAQIDAAWKEKYGEQWPDITIDRVKEPKQTGSGS